MSNLSYEETCRELQRMGILEEGPIPPLPTRPPRYDDEVLGVSFFRTLLADSKLEKMTLQRTFFGRSEVRNVSFHGTNLSESTACWNDFIKVDFSNADLARSDLRSSIFKSVSFRRACLRNCDFRGSSFESCDFSGADMEGTLMVKSWKWFFKLSSTQRKVIDWHIEPGSEPDGG